MKASVEKIENNVADVAIEVDESLVSQALDESYRKLVTQVTVPGFRKGKVPRKVLEMRVGKEVLYKQAQDILIPRAYAEALKEINVKPIGRPQVRVEAFEDGKPCRLRVEVLVRPEVELGDYNSIRIASEPVTVTDEEVDSQLQRLREARAVFVKLDKEVVEHGDYINVDLEVYVDGELIPGVSRKDSMVLVDGEHMDKEIEEALLGAHPGEEKEVTLVISENSGLRAYAGVGKEAFCKIKVNGIYRQDLPVLDDEFARKAARVESVDELKAQVRERIKSEKERAEARRVREMLLHELVEKASVEIPDAAVEERAEELFGELKEKLKVYKLSLEEYLERSQVSEGELRESYREEARRALKEEFVLDALAQAEGIEVTAEELAAALASLARIRGITQEALRRALESSGGLGTIRDGIARDKVMELLIKRCVVNPEAQI